MAIPAEVFGSFGALGGEVTTVLKWTPDPDDVEIALIEIAKYYERLGPPLRAARRVARADIKERFSTETDPEGNPWIPLSAAYAAWKRKRKRNAKILVLTGDLKSAATNEDAFRLDEDEIDEGMMMYDASGLPEYWIIHQLGSTYYTPGYMSNRERRKLKLDVFDEDEIGIGRGNNVPPRPFIGISADAEEMIFNAFDLWFYEGIKTKVTSAGIMKTVVGGKVGPTIDLA